MAFQDEYRKGPTPIAFGLVKYEGVVPLAEYTTRDGKAQLYWYLLPSDVGTAFRLEFQIQPRGLAVVDKTVRNEPAMLDELAIKAATEGNDLSRTVRYLLRLRAIYDPAGSNRREVRPVGATDVAVLKRLYHSEPTDQELHDAGA